jgi:hypothetical protein
MRRLSAGVNALSQKTSIHRAKGSTASSIGPQTIDVGVAITGELVGHDVRAEEGDLVGDLAREAREPGLAVDGEVVARLHLERGGALPVHLVDEALRRARSSSSDAARVAATVRRMPPATYGWPAMRAANSSARSPAKTRCVWLSTNPGMTARPSASTTTAETSARERVGPQRGRPRRYDRRR